MADLHLRDIPEELYERLREQARMEKRSIDVEVISLLERALPPPEPVRSRMEALEDILRHRSSRPAELGLPDSTTLLREDRER